MPTGIKPFSRRRITIFRWIAFYIYPEMHPPQRLQHSTSWYPMLPQNYHLHMAAILILLFIVELSWPHLTPHIHIVSASTTLACAVLHNSNALVSCPYRGRPDMFLTSVHVLLRIRVEETYTCIMFGDNIFVSVSFHPSYQTRPLSKATAFLLLCCRSRNTWG